jgi:cytochrome c peroxidase
MRRKQNTLAHFDPTQCKRSNHCNKSPLIEINFQRDENKEFTRIFIQLRIANEGTKLISFIQKIQAYIYESIDNDYQDLNSKLNYIFTFVFVIVTSLIFIFFWPKETKQAPISKIGIASYSVEPIQPIPLNVELSEAKVELGKKLFHDPILSKDNSLACAGCHDLEKGGVDHLPRSIGINKKEGEINAPTVFNSGFNFRQFWDGRSETLEDQIGGPLANSKEMNNSWEEVIQRLSSHKEYNQFFSMIYVDGVTTNNIKNALAEFEKSLYTPNSRFDQFLRGDSNALTEEEKKGYQLFKDNGCIACHQGMNIGGNMYQTFGVFGNYFQERGNTTNADNGLYNLTGNEQDRYKFKVPSLRNVALTAPYFHDGSVDTLERAISIMAKYQLGRNLEEEEIQPIAAFLRT